MRNKLRIVIYYDKDFNFYVERTIIKKMLPENFISFSQSDRVVLAEAYPDMDEMIMTAQVSNSSARKEIENLIEKYNEDCIRGKVNRWYKISKDYKFILINDSEKPIRILQSVEYNGEDDGEKIIEYIKSIEKKLKEESYGVFTCPKCNELQFQRIIKNHLVCCKCNEEFDEGICIARYTSKDGSPRTLAVAKFLLEKNKKNTEQVKKVQDGVMLYPFTFQGVVYRFSLPECKLLHNILYKNFACDAVFEVENEGVRFTENYLRYLKCLHDNNIRPDLYEQSSRIITDINAQENSIKTMERAFYWYINNFDLNDKGIMAWKTDGQIYTFVTAEQYVQQFIRKPDERLMLTKLFNDLTCGTNFLFDNEHSLKNIFYGYSPNEQSELSRLIYDQSHRFIYVLDNTIVDFGEDFIDNLHLQDDLISIRNQFLESIIFNDKFWVKIKNAYNDVLDSGFNAEDETYYDRLCFYQFAIRGKDVLNYKNLSIKNSSEGFRQIKAIVRQAYVDHDKNSLVDFNALVELSKNDSLCERMDKLACVKEDSSFGDSLSFDDLMYKIRRSTRSYPTMELYLTCCDLTSDKYKQIQIRFEEHIDTFNGHLKSILRNKQGKSLTDAINRFNQDSDINDYIRYVLNNRIPEGLDEFYREKEIEFKKLKSAISKLEQLNEETRSKAMRREISGQKSKNVFDVSSAKPETVLTTSNGITPERKIERLSQGSSSKNEQKSNIGDRDDEWA